MPRASVVEVGEGPPPDLSPYERLSKEQYRDFVDYVIMDPTDYSKAAARAGYSTKHDNHVKKAWELMKNDLIAAAVAQKMNERLERTMITQDRILQELAIIGFSDLDDYSIDPMTGQIKLTAGTPAHALRAVSSIKHIVTVEDDGDGGTRVNHTTEFKLWPKIPALTLAAKHLGMLDDRLKIEGEVVHRQVWEIGGRQIEF